MMFVKPIHSPRARKISQSAWTLDEQAVGNDPEETTMEDQMIQTRNIILGGQTLVKIEVYTRNDRIEEIDAWRLLARVRSKLSKAELVDWMESGKKRFLMGEMQFADVKVVKPLDEAQAEKAVNEYLEKGF
jgi:hypothetical protein